MYVNEIVKSIMRELIEKVYQITKIIPYEHQIHLTCKWPVAHRRCQTMRISDDDGTRAMLELHPSVN